MAMYLSTVFHVVKTHVYPIIYIVCAQNALKLCYFDSATHD